MPHPWQSWGILHKICNILRYITLEISQINPYTAECDYSHTRGLLLNASLDTDQKNDFSDLDKSEIYTFRPRLRMLYIKIIDLISSFYWYIPQDCRININVNVQF